MVDTEIVAMHVRAAFDELMKSAPENIVIHYLGTSDIDSVDTTERCIFIKTAMEAAVRIVLDDRN